MNERIEIGGRDTGEGTAHRKAFALKAARRGRDRPHRTQARRGGIDGRDARKRERVVDGDGRHLLFRTEPSSLLFQGFWGRAEPRGKATRALAAQACPALRVGRQLIECRLSRGSSRDQLLAGGPNGRAQFARDLAVRTAQGAAALQEGVWHTSARKVGA